MSSGIISHTGVCGLTLGGGSRIKPWTAWQCGFDGLAEHGARNYWKSHHLKDLNDNCMVAIKEYALKMPSEECEVFILHMEGVPSRIQPESTAFPHRYTPFILNIHTPWQSTSEDERCIKWGKIFTKLQNPSARGYM